MPVVSPARLREGAGGWARAIHVRPGRDRGLTPAPAAPRRAALSTPTRQSIRVTSSSCPLPELRNANPISRPAIITDPPTPPITASIVTR